MPHSTRCIYIASQGNKAAIPCKHCHESDHPSAECAIASMLHKGRVSPPELPSSPGPDRAVFTRGRRPAPYLGQRPICSSWNNGTCKYPGRCFYAHVCMSCYDNHPASACRERTIPAMPQKHPLGPPNRI